MNQTAIRLSVAIITYNEERNIERCIRSVLPVADEIVVVDSFSTDRTQEICQRLNVKFVEHPFEGYIEQIRYTLTQVSFDCVLTIDADEALSETLASSIARVKQNWTYNGYTFNRLTNYCGTWIRHCGWYPDKKLRLYDQREGSWQGINPHYSFEMNQTEKTAHLPGNLLHYSYYNLEEHVSKLNTFSSLSAQEYFQKGKKVFPLVHIVLYPMLTFFNRYLFHLGFLDGYMGFLVCKSAATIKYLKYAKLYELKKRG